MKKALLSLAVAGLALSVTQTTFAQSNARPGGQNLIVNSHPQFNILEAYPVRAEGFTGQATSFPVGNFNNATVPAPTGTIQPNRRFMGPGPVLGDNNVTSVPGILALNAVPVDTTKDTRQRLNVNAFVDVPTGFDPTNFFVQSFRLTKTPAKSNKCPGTFPGTALPTQFGGPNIRTWWSLIYTPPGTKFTLDLTVVYHGNTTATSGITLIRIERYTWVVRVTFDSLRDVINVLHSNALGTSEIPCIAAEDMYLALRDSVALIQNATDLTSAQDQLFKMEALVLAFSAFGDCFIAEDFFNTLPPSNDMQLGAFGWTGIIDTIENPCACKILVDIEKLAVDYNIVSA